MLLSIITRTFNQRPRGLARNQQSVSDQTDSANVQHLIVVDSVGRGVGWSFANLKNVAPQLLGDYVMLLDDDDFLTDHEFVRLLAEQVENRPDVVIVQMAMGDGRLLPDDAHWEKAPVHSFIACSCYIVRRDVFIEHVGDFKDAYDGDFEFINAVVGHCHSLKFWKFVASRVGRVSNGRPE